MRDGAADRIRAFAATAASPERLPEGAERLLAVGWATVETDRAVGELAGVPGIAPTSFRAAPASVALGSSCLVARMSLSPGPGEIVLVIVEPATEGRIAAGLARWDEGPLVAWYGGSLSATVAGTPGPFGPERLVGRDPLTGPHRLLVAAAPGTIPT